MGRRNAAVLALFGIVAVCVGVYLLLGLSVALIVVGVVAVVLSYLLYDPATAERRQ